MKIETACGLVPDGEHTRNSYVAPGFNAVTTGDPRRLE